MSEHDQRPVVVAVGHDPIEAALSFAVDEAVRSHSSLRLVHVVHLLAQGPETLLIAETDLERVGRLALNDAVSHARDLAPQGVEVTSELRIGRVVPTLVDMTADARMVVLQRRGLSHLMRVVTRSVSSGVAGKCKAFR